MTRIKEMEKTGEAEDYKHIKTKFSADVNDDFFLLRSGDIAFT